MISERNRFGLVRSSELTINVGIPCKRPPSNSQIQSTKRTDVLKHNLSCLLNGYAFHIHWKRFKVPDVEASMGFGLPVEPEVNIIYIISDSEHFNLQSDIDVMKLKTNCRIYSQVCEHLTVVCLKHYHAIPKQVSPVIAFRLNEQSAEKVLAIKILH